MADRPQDTGASLRDRAVVNGANELSPPYRASVPSAASIRFAADALRNSIYRTADDNIDRAVASALYRQQNSEIARCFLRLVAAQGTSAFGHDPQGREAKPAGPVVEDHAPKGKLS